MLNSQPERPRFRGALFVLSIAVVLLSLRLQVVAQTYPLRLSERGRYLEDQSGKPFLINADSPWTLIQGLTKEETLEYLADRREKGFNTLVVELIESFFSGPLNREGEHPFTSSDFSAPNDAYFAHADWVVERALEHEMLLIMAPAYLGILCGQQGWCSEMIASGESVMRDYGRYIGERYRDYPNILWLAGGDVDPSHTPGASEVMEAMIAGIRETDPGHLWSAQCSGRLSALDCFDRPWLDVNNVYYSNCHDGPAKTRHEYEADRALPFFFLEGRYEGAIDSDENPPVCVRSQAYWSILGGAFGHCFGNWPIWFFGSGWQEALDLEGSTSMEIMGRLFRSRYWYKLVPDYDHTVLVSGFGSISDISYASAARTDDGKTIIAYLPRPRTVGVDLSTLVASEAIVRWYDPSSGEVVEIGRFPADSVHDFTPPSHRGDDWVLVIDDAAEDFPLPGASEIVDQTGHFRRGDLDGSQSRNVSDVIMILEALFKLDPFPACMKTADVNDDGIVDISDGVFLLLFLFFTDVVELNPPFDACGIDPTLDDLECVQSTGC